MNDKIIIKGANQHNLRNVDLELPKNELIVFTGVSGSGKSSLAFDTIFAEGQRRYVESLSTYARQFLGQMDKPDVESIEGLSPAISIDQKSTSNNPRSTVGTVTEIYDYLRLLFARIGVPHCTECDDPIKPQSIDEIVDKIMKLAEGTKIQIIAPVVRGKKGEFVSLINELKQDGFVNRVGVQGAVLIVAGEKGSLCIFGFVGLRHIDARELAVLTNFELVFPRVLDQVLIGAAGCAEILPLIRGDGQGGNILFRESSVHRAGDLQPDRRQSAPLEEVAGQAFPDLLAADGDVGGQLVDKCAILSQGVPGVVRFAVGLVAAVIPGVSIAVQIQNIVTIF